MVDFSLSEFSRIRLQLAEDKSRQASTDRQVFVQYLMSIGAHAAIKLIAGASIMRKLLIVLSFITSLAPSPYAAALDIFACEPEWGALAQELGGDRVAIYTATNAFQDPHQIQAKPSLLAKARRAILVVCTGSELEIGWLPVVLRQSGNDAVQPGKPGYLKPPIMFASSKYLLAWIVPTAILIRAVIRISNRSAQHRFEPRPWRSVWPKSIRPTRLFSNTLQIFHHAGRRRFNAGIKGGALSRRGDREALQGLCLSGELAGPQGSGAARAQTRCRADQRPPRRGLGSAETATGRDGSASRL